MAHDDIPVADRGDITKTVIVYALYVAFFVPFAMLVGVILAYVFRGDAPAWQQGHVRFQIRTFWIGLLFAVVSAVTQPLFGLGFLLGTLTAIWIVVRAVKGILWLRKGAEVPDPASWLFGDRRG